MSAEPLADALERSRDIVCVLDSSGRIAHVSPAVLRVLGWEASDVAQRYLLNLLHPEDVQQVTAAFASATPAAPEVDVLARVRTRNHGWRWLDVSATVSFGDGGPGSIELIARDVSARHDTEEALRSTAQRLATLVGAATGGIVMEDAEERITVVSSAFCEMFGIPLAPGALVGADAATAAEAIAHQLADPGAWSPRAAAIVAAGEPVRAEEIALADGRTLARDYVPIGDGDGHLWIYRDVTAYRRLEAELRAAVDAKSEFLATMSHEIRTPLSGIAGAAELLLDVGLDPAARDLVAIIHEAAGALGGLLGDVLDASRIEAGHVDLAIVDYDLRAALKAIAGVLEPTLRGRPLRLEVVVSPQLPASLRGDASRIRQIVLNLASNAAKYTERGVVRLLAEPAGDKLCVTVTDTGPGIAPERIERLFEPWTRAHHERTDGTGLGLGIARRLARAMGGEVSARSRVGEGSAFTLELPLVEGEARPAPQLEPAPAPLHGRVLAAEDSPALRRLLHRQLERLGLDAVIVDNGADAVDAAARERFDAILLDVRMPGLGGLEAAKRIRAAESAARVPIIALTAENAPDEAARCLAAGMDAHVAKPAGLGALRAALAGALAAPPVLDCAVLGELGDVAVLDDLLRVYRGGMDAQLERVRAAAGLGSAEALRAAAHAIRSEACSFGAGRLAAAARVVEYEPAAGGLEPLAQALAETVAALDARLG